MDGRGSRDLINLLVSAKCGDSKALNKLLKGLRPGIVADLCGRLQSHPATEALAEELAQEVLVRVNRSIGTIRATHSTALRSWVRTVTRRVVIDWYRRRQEELQRRVWEEASAVEDRALSMALVPPVLDATVKADDDPVLRALGHLLFEAQEVLSEGTRTVVRQRLLYGATWKEAGRAADTSAGGAKRRWQRAVARLRREVLERILEVEDPDLRSSLLERMGELPHR